MTDAAKDLFLSHHPEAADFVGNLAVALADPAADGSEAPPFSVWTKDGEIQPGASLPAMINQGLETSRFIGVVLTPLYFHDHAGWSQAEWHAALNTDPDNRRPRVIPLLAEDCPYVPFVLRHLDYIDMRRDAFLAGVQRLRTILGGERAIRPVTHRGQLIAPSGRVDRATLLAERATPSAAPDAVSERLSCNLLPVESYPKYVYEAPLLDTLFDVTKRGRVPPSRVYLKALINKAQEHAGIQRFSPAFRQYGDKIFSFFDLTTADNPLACISDHTKAAEYPTTQLLDDDDSRGIITSLLNMAVTRHATRAGLCMTAPPRQRVYFPPAADNSPRTFEWTPTRRRSIRTVAKPMISKEGVVQFWRHAGAQLRVVYLGQRYYLQITPTWVLTKDGHELMTGPKVGGLVVKWTGAERNLHVLYHVRFWSTVLRAGRGSISIRAGDRTIDVRPTPAFVQQPYGIADDQRDLLGRLDGEAALIADEEDDVLADALEHAAAVADDLIAGDSMEGEGVNDEIVED